MLRGNHESPAINKLYGFYQDCLHFFFFLLLFYLFFKGHFRYSDKLWKLFNELFCCLPIAAVFFFTHIIMFIDKINYIRLLMIKFFVVMEVFHQN
jgi:hypothetical protein